MLMKHNRYNNCSVGNVIPAYFSLRRVLKTVLTATVLVTAFLGNDVQAQDNSDIMTPKGTPDSRVSQERPRARILQTVSHVEGTPRSAKAASDGPVVKASAAEVKAAKRNASAAEEKAAKRNAAIVEEQIRKVDEVRHADAADDILAARAKALPPHHNDAISYKPATAKPVTPAAETPEYTAYDIWLQNRNTSSLHKLGGGRP
jgi:hypothetical protein